MKDELNKSKHDSLFPHAYGAETHVPEKHPVSHLSFIDLVATYLGGALIVLLAVGVGVRAAKHAEQPNAVDASSSTESAVGAGSIGAGDEKSNKANSANGSDQGSKVQAPPEARHAPGELWALVNRRVREEAPQFNSVEANRRIDRAARLTGVCIAQTDLHTITQIAITFEHSGRATQVDVDGGPFVGTAQGACIARIMRGVSAPAFQGAPVTVRRSFRID